MPIASAKRLDPQALHSFSNTASVGYLKGIILAMIWFNKKTSLYDPSTLHILCLHGRHKSIIYFELGAV